MYVMPLYIEKAKYLSLVFLRVSSSFCEWNRTPKKAASEFQIVKWQKASNKLAQNFF